MAAARYLHVRCRRGLLHLGQGGGALYTPLRVWLGTDFHTAATTSVQMATGCTFGKGLIERTGYGKWALTLVDSATGQAVRVSVKPGTMQAAMQSPFVKMRHEGVALTDVPLDVSRPLVQGLMGRSEGDLFAVSEVFAYALGPRRAACFDTVVCSGCGELVAENKARLKQGQPVCRPCAGGTR
ncbi:MAG: FmdE family protein [Pseudomonadota bacterium]